MFSARDLLGQLLQSGMTGSTSSRVGHAMGPQGLGSAGSPLGRVLQGLRGGGEAGGGDLASLARGMFSDGGRPGGSPLAMGGLAALAGAVLGGRKGGTGGALGGGALALLGTLAMNALRGQGAAQPGTPGGGAPQDAAAEAPLGVREPQDAAEEQELERRALLIVQAMVNAAKADGQVDAAEIARITGRLEGAGSDQEARAFLAEELRWPADLEGLARAVPDAEVAVQVYAASLLAIEVDRPAEEAYLRQLASRLSLGPEAVRTVHSALGAPLPA